MTVEYPESVERVRDGVPDAGEAGEVALTAGEVSRALAELAGWTGDEGGIWRTVVVPPDQVPVLVDRVQAEARRSNDHAHARQESDAVTFVLRTGGTEVTRPDVELAARIDAVVAEQAAGG